MHYLEKVVRIIARQYNLTVVFEGNDAKTDGNKVYLPYFTNPSPELEEDYMGYAHHESGHCLFTDFNEWKKIKLKIIATISNIVEDYRIENLMKKEYPGAVYFLDTLNSKILTKLATKDWTLVPELQKFNYQLSCLTIGHAPAPSASVQSLVMMGILAEANDRVKTLTSTKAVIQYAEEIVAKLKKELPPPEEQSPQQQQLSNMLSEDTESVESEFMEEFEVSLDAQQLQAFKTQLTLEQANRKNSFSEKNHSIPVTTKYDEVLNYSTTTTSLDYQALMKSVSKFVVPAKEKLERALISYQRNHIERNTKRGRINSRTLAKTIVQDAYKTPFKQTVISQSNKVVISILGDLSGSMRGRKEQLLRETTLSMALVLDSLGIPFEILGFNDQPCSLVANYSRGIDNLSRFNRTTQKLCKYVFKDFNNKNFYGISKMIAGGSNPDGEAVAWAAERIRERREHRKIILVLSDGQPASDGNSGILCSDLKRRVLELKKENIECIGIGINSESVKEFYNDYLVINNIEELPTQAINKLANILIKNITK